MSRISKYLCQLGVFFLFLGVLTATSSDARQQANPQMNRFKLADSYIRTGQYDRAIPLLEKLYASDSTSVVYYRKLKEAYAGIKRYDEAIALVNDRLEMNRTPSLMAEKAALLSQKGEPDRALEIWHEAIETAPSRSGTYRTVYLSMIDHRRFDEAIDVLRNGREQLDQPNAFAVDLAHLYGLTSRHRDAADEYLSILSNQPDRLPIVKRRLSRYSDQEGALQTTLEAVEAQVEEAPLHRPYRELAGWLYLQVENFERAFDEYRAIDRLEEENGAVLYSFARKAAEAVAYETATRAYERILEQYPEMPSAPDAQLGLAEMHRKQAEDTDERAFDYSGNRQEAPHYTAALEAYKRFTRTYPDHPKHAKTLREIGLLQLNVFRRPNQAETIFQQITEQYPDSPEATLAELNPGRIAPLPNDLE
jgi:tetratricopeptide (TPR) repeat protein